MIKDKLFYFGNVEWFRLAESRSRIRYMLKPMRRDGIFRMPPQRGDADAQSAGARGVQGPDGDGGPDARQAAGRHPDGGRGDRRRHRQHRRTERREVQTTARRRPVPVLPHRHASTTTSRTPPAVGCLPLEPLRRPARRPEQQRVAVPGIPEPWRPGVGALHSGRAPCGRRSARASSTSSSSAASDATGLGTYSRSGVNEGMFNCTGLGCQSLGGKGWNFNFPGATTGTLASRQRPDEPYGRTPAERGRGGQ